MINYNNDGLVISMPTKTPQATHSKLSKAIIFSLKHQMQVVEAIPLQVKEGNVCLLDLLETLQPDERQLSNMQL